MIWKDSIKLQCSIITPQKNLVAFTFIHNHKKWGLLGKADELRGEEVWLHTSKEDTWMFLDGSAHVVKEISDYVAFKRGMVNINHIRKFWKELKGKGFIKYERHIDF